MRSNVCRIEKGTMDLEAILKESEKVAVYNELSHKQALQLRLLCEEIDGMLPKIVDEFDGDLWIELEDGVCKVNVSVAFNEFTMEKKEALINVSKNKKNAAVVGIIGKIRSEIENIFLDEEVLQLGAMPSANFDLSTGYCDGVDFAYIWSLEQYKNTVREEKKSEAWDELEKSVIASVADDVIVGVKGNNASIVIVKKFN